MNYVDVDTEKEWEINSFADLEELWVFLPDWIRQMAAFHLGVPDDSVKEVDQGVVE